MNYSECSPQQALELKNNGAVLVDVREESERKYGFIEDSIHISLKDINFFDLINLSKSNSRVFVFYCAKGVRSLRAISILYSEPLSVKFFNLKGGIEAWRGAGMEVNKI